MLLSCQRMLKLLELRMLMDCFFLWAIVNTDEEHPKEKRCLEFYKTGQLIETPLERLNYLGTCKLFIMQELCLYVFENCYETNKINEV